MQRTHPPSPLLFCLIAFTVAGMPTHSPARELPRPYLMLVTFGAPRLQDWTKEQCQKANTWPYAGIASIVVGAYNTDPVPSRKDLDASVQLLRENRRVHVWPWVFLNRMMGRGKGPAHSSAATSPDFEKIKGWDLEDKVEAKSSFLAAWRLCLRLAKDLGAPGVVLDMETYNDYSTYQLSALAEYGGWSIEQTTSLLKGLGKEMATIAGQEYPSAIIWNLFTGVGGARTTGLVCEGLLEEATRRKLPMKMVDGGETAVGYYNPSAEVLTAQINSHIGLLDPYTRKYDGRLVAGGTIAPYHEPDKITSWIKDASSSGNRFYKSVDEFRPNFDTLFSRCEYVWVYGASAACCVPFTDTNAATTNALHGMLGEVYPQWQEGYRLLPLPLRTHQSREKPDEVRVNFAEQPVDVSDWTKGDPRTDMTQAELVVGPDTNIVKVGPKSVKMTVNVNWKDPAGAKYPIGWPMIHKTFNPPIDLSGFEYFEFWLRTHSVATLPSPPLKYGFSNDDREPLWRGAETTKKDEWVRVRVPLDQIGARDRITRLSFYVAESWYRDGDVITFYLDGLKFLRQTTPQIGSITVEPMLAPFGSSSVTVQYRLLGGVAEARCRLRWRLTAGKGTTAIKSGELLDTAPGGQIVVPVQGLATRAYNIIVDLIDANGKRLDSRAEQFAVLGKKYR